MKNPNPELITDSLWRLHDERPNQSWKLSGIYADKKGYHNTVNANKRNWPNNYSIQLPLDLKGDFNKARALDETMSTSEMIRVTGLMKKSALDKRDNRLSALKEFYGTLDGKTVFGLGKSNLTGPWFSTSADNTHLWHLHNSFFTSVINDWKMLSPIHSVWRGETFEEWSVQNMTDFLPKLNDTGEDVRYWQHLHNLVRTTVTPPSPAINVDGEYGPATQAAFKDFWLKCGGTGGYDASWVTGWLGVQYHRKLATFGNVADVSTEQIDAAVAKYLKGKNFSLVGDLTGKVQL